MKADDDLPNLHDTYFINFNEDNRNFLNENLSSTLFENYFSDSCFGSLNAAFSYFFRLKAK